LPKYLYKLGGRANKRFSTSRDGGYLRQMMTMVRSEAFLDADWCPLGKKGPPGSSHWICPTITTIDLECQPQNSTAPNQLRADAALWKDSIGRVQKENATKKRCSHLRTILNCIALANQTWSPSSKTNLAVHSTRLANVQYLHRITSCTTSASLFRSASQWPPSRTYTSMMITAAILVFITLVKIPVIPQQTSL